MAAKYSLDPTDFYETVKATAFDNKGTKAEMITFLVVANEHGLNPLTREIYAFPKQGGGIQTIVSVDGWSRIVNDHPAYDGMHFQDHTDDKGNVTAITCRIFRKDRREPIECTEYLQECTRSSSVWKQWPRRMLRHRSYIQCARYAFGFSFIDPEEAERIKQVESNAAVATLPGKASLDALTDRLSAPSQATGEVLDAEFQENTHSEDVDQRPHEERLEEPTDPELEEARELLAKAPSVLKVNEIEEHFKRNDVSELCEQRRTAIRSTRGK